MTATLTSKGQITIPLLIRQRLRLKPGDILDFDSEAPFLKAHRVVDREKARQLLGSKAKELEGKSVEEWMDWLRGPVQLSARARKKPHDPRRR